MQMSVFTQIETKVSARDRLYGTVSISSSFVYLQLRSTSRGVQQNTRLLSVICYYINGV